MTDKELQRLNRKELLELLIQQIRENEGLKEKLREYEELAKNNEIRLAECGTMAEAALRLNGVFEAADAAVKQYTDSIMLRSGRQQEECERLIAEANKKAEEILNAAEEEKNLKIKEAEAAVEAAEKQKLRRKQEADAYWLDISDRIGKLMKELPARENDL